MNCWNYLLEICTFSFFSSLAFVIINKSKAKDLWVTINLPWIDTHKYASLGIYLMQMIISIKCYYCSMNLFYSSEIPIIHNLNLYYLSYIWIISFHFILFLIFIIWRLSWMAFLYTFESNMTWSISLFSFFIFIAWVLKSLFLPAASHPVLFLYLFEWAYYFVFVFYLWFYKFHVFFNCEFRKNNS